MVFVATNDLNKENRKSEIKVICAWCGKPTGEKDGKGIEGISHGLCTECLAKLRIKCTEEESGNDSPASEASFSAEPP